MSKDPKAILKQCVEAPFGKAEEILKEAGYWDETGAPVGSLRTYKVRIEGEEIIDYDQVHTVEATSPDEAIEMAENEVGDWIDIRTTTIVSSKD